MTPRFRSLAAVAALTLGTGLVASCQSADVPQAVPEAPPEARAQQGERVAAPAKPAKTTAYRTRGVMRVHEPGQKNPDGLSCASPQLSYYGGPILQSPEVIAVFWNSDVNDSIQAGIGQFFEDVTQSSYWQVLQEYDTVGLPGGTSKGNQVFLPGTFGGNFLLTPSKCPAGTAKCDLTDDDVQIELANQITAANLPAPTLDCTGNVQTVYMVSFPPNITLSGPNGTGTSCAQFCAYHNTGTTSQNVPLVYGALTDCGGCGLNLPTALDTATHIASHELAEAATDTDVGLVTGFADSFPLGWYDSGSNNCGEIADICDAGSSNSVITVNGRMWSVQQLWSNQQQACVVSSTPLPICSGTTTTGCRPCSCGDNGLSCNGTTGVCETDASSPLYGACEQCTATSNTCATCTNDACVGCTPITACPAGDNCGTVSNGCGGQLNCGVCAFPETCGGGSPTNPNVCGCTPATTCPAGYQCGTIPDGCGGTVSCGTCSGTGTCTTTNTCACTPATFCPKGYECGEASDGCGGMINCGSCGGGQTCSSSNVCVGGTTGAGGGATSSSSSSSTAASSSAATTTTTTSSGAGGSVGESSSASTSASTSGTAGTPSSSSSCSVAAGSSGEEPAAPASAFALLALAAALRSKRGASHRSVG